MRVIVTGGAGFIGSNLVRALVARRPPGDRRRQPGHHLVAAADRGRRRPRRVRPWRRPPRRGPRARRAGPVRPRLPPGRLLRERAVDGIPDHRHAHEHRGHAQRARHGARGSAAACSSTPARRRRTATCRAVRGGRPDPAVHAVRDQQAGRRDVRALVGAPVRDLPSVQRVWPGRSAGPLPQRGAEHDARRSIGAGGRIRIFGRAATRDFTYVDDVVRVLLDAAARRRPDGQRRHRRGDAHRRAGAADPARCSTCPRAA